MKGKKEEKQLYQQRAPSTPGMQPICSSGPGYTRHPPLEPQEAFVGGDWLSCRQRRPAASSRNQTGVPKQSEQEAFS